MLGLIVLCWIVFAIYKLGRRGLYLLKNKVPLPLPKTFNIVWDLEEREMMVLTGWKLNMLRWATYVPILGSLLLCLQRRAIKFNMEALMKYDFSHLPGTMHSNNLVNLLEAREKKDDEVSKESKLELKVEGKYDGFQFLGFDSYKEAYESGKTNAVEVARRLIKAVIESNKGYDALNAIINLDSLDLLEQAEASYKRRKEGRLLSEYDGIPITIKDEIDVKGYPTFVGTSFLGKSNMMEIGIQPFGFNKTFGHVKTPYDTQCDSGGSSSGSAAAVASGLVPAALGCDGGGSIRIPSAFCGVVGLKANIERISEEGVFPLCFSVGHVGPITTNVKDSLTMLKIIAGATPGDMYSYNIPRRVNLKPLAQGLTNWKVGVCEEWLSLCKDQSNIDNFRASVVELERFGATIVPFRIPCFEQMRIAHTTTIASEMLCTMKYYERDLTKLMAVPNLSLQFANTFEASFLLQSQKIRTFAIQTFRNLFFDMDVMITPSSGVVAPRFYLPGVDMNDGISDATTLTDTMVFVFISNLIGNPAVVIPSGYTAGGLPTSIQIMSRWFCEEDALYVASLLESKSCKAKPKIYFDILN